MLDCSVDLSQECFAKFYPLICRIGCGTGVLSIGCAMLGAGFVTGFDIDDDALAVCKSNLDDFDINFADVVHCDVLKLGGGDDDEENLLLRKKFDTVVMNPPFGKTFLLFVSLVNL